MDQVTSRLALRFDGLTTFQLRAVLAAYAQAWNGTQDAPLSAAPGVVVGCDGPERFNASVPPLKGNALALFLEALQRPGRAVVLPTFDPAVNSTTTAAVRP